MKTKTLFSIFLLSGILFTHMCFAKTWRVNNKSNYNGTTLFGDNFGGTAGFPVFKQLNDAINFNSVLNGDTIHVEGSELIYENAAVIKKLIIIGPGYFLDENPKTSNIQLEANIGTIIFLDASAGSQILGMHIHNNFNGYAVDIRVNNIVVKRCRLDDPIGFDDNLTDEYILENFFSNTSSPTTSAINSGNIFPTGLVFNNNICKRILVLTNGTIVFSALECRNNVFDCPAISGNPSIQLIANSFQNNILKTPGAIVDVTGADISYNTNVSGQFGSANNNITVANMSTLFVDPATNTTDGDYQLLPGSAIGSNGTERGVFGGQPSTRYTLSGLAAIPVIYKILTTSNGGSSDLNVTIQARTIK